MTDHPPAEPIWWTIQDKNTGVPIYTKARLWFEARVNFGGGDPVTVTNEELIKSLEKDFGDNIRGSDSPE